MHLAPSPNSLNKQRHCASDPQILTSLEIYDCPLQESRNARDQQVQRGWQEKQIMKNRNNLNITSICFPKPFLVKPFYAAHAYVLKGNWLRVSITNLRLTKVFKAGRSRVVGEAGDCRMMASYKFHYVRKIKKSRHQIPCRCQNVCHSTFLNKHELSLFGGGQVALWEKAMTLGSSPAEYNFVAVSVVRESQEIRGPIYDPFSNTSPTWKHRYKKVF